MPWQRAVGSTSPSMPRTRIEYGGCSVTNRSKWYSRVTLWALKTGKPEYDDEPMQRTPPWCRGTERAPTVSAKRRCRGREEPRPPHGWGSSRQ